MLALVIRVIGIRLLRKSVQLSDQRREALLAEPIQNLFQARMAYRQALEDGDYEYAKAITEDWRI